MLKAGPLEERFRALRRRVAALASLSGLGWALLAAAAVWLAFAWFDLLWELSPAARIAANTLAVIAAIVGLASALWRARQDGRPLVLAGRLDEAAATGGQIRSGYDLAVESADLQALESGDSQALLIAQHDTAKVLARLHAELRRGLAHLTIARAATLAATVSSSRVVSTRTLRITVASICGVALCFAAAALFMPRLVATQWLRFSDPAGDHPPYSQIQFAIEPGGTQVLYGHGLEVKATTKGPPVEQLELVLQGSATEPEEVLPMFPESDGHWRGVLSRVTTPTQYFVRAGRAAASATAWK